MSRFRMPEYGPVILDSPAGAGYRTPNESGSDHCEIHESAGPQLYTPWHNYPVKRTSGQHYDRGGPDENS